MIAHLKLGLVFLKTFKTASTTTELFLEDAFWRFGSRATEQARWRIYFNGFVTPREKHGPPNLFQISKMRISPYFSSNVEKHLHRLRAHSCQADISNVLGRENYDSFIKIAGVRNPFDLLVSAYYWIHRGNDLPPFSDWLTGHLAASNPWNKDLRPSKLVNSRILRFERLHEDLAKLCDEFELAHTRELPRAKTNTRSEETHYRHFFSSRDRKAVENSFYREWLEQFDYSF